MRFDELQYGHCVIVNALAGYTVPISLNIQVSDDSLSLLYIELNHDDFACWELGTFFFLFSYSEYFSLLSKYSFSVCEDW